MGRSGPGSLDYRLADQPIRQAFLTGIAITIPAIITLVVLQVAVGFIVGILDPVVVAVTYLFPGMSRSRTAIQILAVGVLVLTVFVIGFVANQTTGDRWARRFHAVMEAIPVVGPLYESFQEMSDLLLDSDTHSFREVKLVEFPREGSYAVAFVTADTASLVETAADTDDLITLYVPLAPNPVMGGFVVHVPREQVMDVDMSVEEGVQSIITSGVAVDAEHGVAHQASSDASFDDADTPTAGSWDRLADETGERESDSS